MVPLSALTPALSRRERERDREESRRERARHYGTCPHPDVQWVHDSIVYRPGSSTSTTAAQEIFVQRAGVCRDFAHLGITL